MRVRQVPCNRNEAASNLLHRSGSCSGNELIEGRVVCCHSKAFEHGRLGVFGMVLLAIRRRYFLLPHRSSYGTFDRFNKCVEAGCTGHELIAIKFDSRLAEQLNIQLRIVQEFLQGTMGFKSI